MKRPGGKFYLIISACWMLSTGLMFRGGHTGEGLMFLSIALMYLTFGLLDL